MRVCILLFIIISCSKNVSADMIVEPNKGGNFAMQSDIS